MKYIHCTLHALIIIKSTFEILKSFHIKNKNDFEDWRLTCKAGASRTLYGIRDIFLTVFFEPLLAILCDVGEGPKEFLLFPIGEPALPVLSKEDLLALLLVVLKRSTEDVFLVGEDIGLLEVPVGGTDIDASFLIDCKGSQRSSDRIRLFIMFWLLCMQFIVPTFCHVNAIRHIKMITKGRIVVIAQIYVFSIRFTKVL